MPPTLLAILPEELIARIASFITDQPDILALALTSQQLHRIAAEFLYYHRHLQLGRVAGNHAALNDLTVRLLTRPDLAACVKHLSIRGEWTADWDRAKLFDTTKVHPAVRSAIYKLARDRRARKIWLNDVLDREREEALVVLLICSLPNLRTLDTDLPTQPGPHYNRLMKEVRNGHSKGLQNLRDIVFVRSCKASLDLDLVRPTFSLPALRRLFLYNVGRGWSQYRGMGKQAHLDMLSTLQKRRECGASPLCSVEHLGAAHFGPEFGRSVRAGRPVSIATHFHT